LADKQEITTGVARVFISSTFEDLKDHIDAVYLAVRRLGHRAEAVEYLAATEQRPLERSLADVCEADVVVFLIAWRYGYVPPGQQYSMTELEYREARKADIPCLIFLAEDASWPKQYVDDDSSNITRFRRELLEQRLVAFFTTPDSLAAQVAISLSQWVTSGARDLSPATPEMVSASEAPGPDVFLSYAHDDVDIARSVSERIGSEQWSVFWDRTIPVGFTWDDIVEGALEAAKCVVVLWSPAASNSEWVRNEAMDGAERRILAPAVIKETKIPLRFRGIQAADLVGWSPQRPDTPGMQALISAVKRLCSRR
jgi:hypothetical protein